MRGVRPAPTSSPGSSRKHTLAAAVAAPSPSRARDSRSARTPGRAAASARVWAAQPAPVTAAATVGGLRGQLLAQQLPPPLRPQGWGNAGLPPVPPEAEPPRRVAPVPSPPPPPAPVTRLTVPRLTATDTEQQQQQQQEAQLNPPSPSQLPPPLQERIAQAARATAVASRSLRQTISARSSREMARAARRAVEGIVGGGQLESSSSSSSRSSSRAGVNVSVSARGLQRVGVAGASRGGVAARRSEQQRTPYTLAVGQKWHHYISDPGLLGQLALNHGHTPLLSVVSGGRVARRGRGAGGRAAPAASKPRRCVDAVEAKPKLVARPPTFPQQAAAAAAAATVPWAAVRPYTEQREREGPPVKIDYQPRSPRGASPVARHHPVTVWDKPWLQLRRQRRSPPGRGNPMKYHLHGVIRTAIRN
eukprot:COSAG01_NODE_832_length_13250_cov_23.422828_7_plen_419_part_00